MTDERRDRVNNRRQQILRDIVNFALQDENSDQKKACTDDNSMLRDNSECDSNLVENNVDCPESKIHLNRRQKRSRKRKSNLIDQRKLSVMGQLMFAEWLINIPPNLSEWLMCFPPAGLRCLISSSSGKTVSILPDGTIIEKIHSTLTRSNHNESTILDCIYVEESRHYVVIDVILWRNFELFQSPAEFRVDWIFTRFLESLTLTECSFCSDNSISIEPISWYTASGEVKIESHRMLMMKMDSLYVSGVSSTFLQFDDSSAMNCAVNEGKLLSLEGISIGDVENDDKGTAAIELEFLEDSDEFYVHVVGQSSGFADSITKIQFLRQNLGRRGVSVAEMLKYLGQA